MLSGFRIRLASTTCFSVAPSDRNTGQESADDVLHKKCEDFVFHSFSLFHLLFQRSKLLKRLERM